MSHAPFAANNLSHIFCTKCTKIKIIIIILIANNVYYCILWYPYKRYRSLQLSVPLAETWPVPADRSNGRRPIGDTRYTTSWHRKHENTLLCWHRSVISKLFEPTAKRETISLGEPQLLSKEKHSSTLFYCTWITTICHWTNQSVNTIWQSRKLEQIFFYAGHAGHSKLGRVPNLARGPGFADRWHRSTYRLNGFKYEFFILRKNSAPWPIFPLRGLSVYNAAGGKPIFT